MGFLLINPMPTPLLKFEEATFRKFQHTIFPDTNWEIREGENWALTGANGSGKTTFLEAIEGRLVKIKGNVAYHLTDANGIVASDPHQLIASVYFSDHSVNYGDFYYQQRYHATETDGIITVRTFLGLENSDVLPELEALDILRLLDMEIIKLSNGQFKKMLIVKALLKRPRLLLLDNLYTGLDTYARAYISDIIGRIAGMGTHIVMVADNGQIPDAITHVMKIDHFSIKRTLPRKDYAAPRAVSEQVYALPVLPDAPAKTFDTAVHLDEVTIAYGGKTVIDHAKWTVRHGEKWALMGPNGAGKSMLLSLIFADHPQAYANKIVLFDRRRGTGESIWDIKDHVGFVSPEMHVYFQQGKTCRDVALSGLHENPYQQVKVTNNIVHLLEELFDYFSITHVTNNLFQRVSTGQQNVALLVRALLKNPPLLLLDEPFQGMDMHTVALAKQLLDAFCRARTLILVSHRPDELPSCIDRQLNIEKGKVFQDKK